MGKKHASQYANFGWLQPYIRCGKMAATVQPVTATNGYVSEHSFDGIIVHLMSSSLLNEDYRFTQFSIANPFIFAKCFTLSVTRIKLPLQAAEPMSKSKSSMDTPNERRRFFS